MKELENPLGTIKITAETEENPDKKIETLGDVKREYRYLGDKQKEHVYAVFLSGRNKLIGDKLLGLGTNNSAQFDTQDLVRTAALVNAAAVILIHNHPSGIPQPTDQDIESTGKIHEALRLLGVNLLDHVIIGKEECYSMRGEGDGPY